MKKCYLGKMLKNYLNHKLDSNTHVPHLKQGLKNSYSNTRNVSNAFISCGFIV